VEAIVERAIESGEAGLAWFYDGLPVAEQVVFSAVAESQEPSAAAPATWTTRPLGEALSAIFDHYGIARTSSLLMAAQQLIDRGFLHKQKRSSWRFFTEYRYTVTVELVRRWLLRRHPLREVLRKLETIDPTAERLYQQAERARQIHDLDRARALYEQALQANPNHFRALIELAETSVQLERFEEAVALFDRVVRFDPVRAFDGRVQALLGAGQRLRQQGNVRDARPFFQQVLELDPGNQQARSWLEQRRPDQAPPVRMRNPFVGGSIAAEEQFVGRRAELSVVVDHVLNRGFLALYGEQGIGKTSLLRRLTAPDVWSLSDRQAAPPVVVYFNCQQAVLPTFSPTRFWQELAREVQDQAAGSEALSASLPESLPLEGLQSALRRLSKESRHILLLLDDFDVALQPASSYPRDKVLHFLLTLSSLVDTSSRPASFVVASRLPLSDSELVREAPTRFWYSEILHERLGRFNDHEVQQLIERMPLQYGLEPVEREWVDQVAGRYPLLLQAALSTLFRAKADEGRFELRQATQAFATVVEPFFADLWRLSTGPERAVMTLIALRNLKGRTGLDVNTWRALNDVLSQQERALRSLERRELVVRPELALVSSVLEWWIIKEIEQRPPHELSAAAEAFELNSPADTRTLAQAMLQVSEQKSAYRSIESWGVSSRLAAV
jgi:tetratricopeptide (TPR) repeat protein